LISCQLPTDITTHSINSVNRRQHDRRRRRQLLSG